MNGRSLIILALAVSIGLGAMIFSRQMLSGGKAKHEEETLEVLVAARDFKDEEVLKPDMVKVARIAKSAVPAGSFSSFKDLEDRWIKATMLEGDVLVEKKLGPKGTPPGMIANIPKGMRAFAIDVTEQSGVSGFILPGHRVDVVQHHNSEKHESRVDTILQNVLVLAAGQVFTRPDERALQSRTVTLALKPEDVHALVSARAAGTLSLALRGVNDHDVLARQPPKETTDPEREKVLRLENEKLLKLEHEKLLKLEEEKRTKIEEELRQVKETLAKKTALPVVTKPDRAPRIATIYRGIGNKELVRTDRGAVAHLEPREPPDPSAFPEGTASQSTADTTAAQVASSGSQPGP
jgi:pilus assembly protein CpaB